MKIAFPTEGYRKLSDKVASTFSRAPTFTIVTYEEGKIGEITVFENQAASIKQGAGPLAVQNLKNHGVTTLITGEVGPGASTILDVLGIEVHQTKSGTKVKNALDDWFIK
ncbi:MAG: NifB/NifX family molybdenum-iron cluster-binding protein [Candidatus Bathyarchaeota archaeon]|nr:NifB/NifX family molybdenum-iron cluster-binding protein [Candidatus Bathyarchaeota archaeon]